MGIWSRKYHKAGTYKVVYIIIRAKDIRKDIPKIQQKRKKAKNGTKN